MGHIVHLETASRFRLEKKNSFRLNFDVKWRIMGNFETTLFQIIVLGNKFNFLEKKLQCFGVNERMLAQKVLVLQLSLAGADT